MLYRIVGFDPGLKTGVTSFTVFENEIHCIESYELDILGVGQYLENRIDENTIIAYEVANKFQASGHMSSEIIGLVKYFSGLHAQSEYSVTQSAWKNLITRDVLKRAGLNVKGTHAKDAAGIGLYVAVTRLSLMKDVLRRPEEAT